MAKSFSWEQTIDFVKGRNSEKRDRPRVRKKGRGLREREGERRVYFDNYQMQTLCISCAATSLGSYKIMKLRLRVENRRRI